MRRQLAVVLVVWAAGCAGGADRAGAVRRCERWADGVRSTLREGPRSLPLQAQIRGHCTMAEDHILSGCAALAPAGAAVDRFTEDYEEACRRGRLAGMRDRDVSMRQREEAWRDALTGVAAAFDGVLATLD